MMSKREECLPTTGDAPLRIYSQCFYQYEDFASLSRNWEFIGYQNTHIVAIGAREGRATLTQELGITVKMEMKFV
jgi:hypothetical protein